MIFYVIFDQLEPGNDVLMATKQPREDVMEYVGDVGTGTTRFRDTVAKKLCASYQKRREMGRWGSTIRAHHLWWGSRKYRIRIDTDRAVFQVMSLLRFLASDCVTLEGWGRTVDGEFADFLRLQRHMTIKRQEEGSMYGLCACARQ